jgi:hypothetical protein
MSIAVRLGAIALILAELRGGRPADNAMEATG